MVAERPERAAATRLVDDRDLTMLDHEEAVAGVALPNDRRPRLIRAFLHLGKEFGNCLGGQLLEEGDLAQPLSQRANMVALQLRQVADRRGRLAQEAATRVHELIERGEERAPDEAADGEGIERTSAQSLRDEVDRERGEECTPAEGHHRRHRARPRRPCDGREGAEWQRQRADHPEGERPGGQRVHQGEAPSTTVAIPLCGAGARVYLDAVHAIIRFERRETPTAS